MKTADVVIGANLGDEGKGLVTDFLASKYGSDALVVRFCGGAQAGHTVTTPEGKRHVFNHFGSGSLCGASTYLSRFFICNPILFLAEAKRLEKLGIRPKVFIDPAAPVTTPYDMMVNQMVEELRGKDRHGSCGVGIGETIERQQHSEYALTFSDLYNFPALNLKLDYIRRHWVPLRLKNLGIKTIAPEWKERIGSQAVLMHFMSDVDAFLECARTASLSCVRQAKHVIFEGAQGLLLDQDHEWFPHVTRSNTGLKNVVSLARAADLTRLNVHYVSRCYATRHGAGPLPHELSQKPYEGIMDLTNVPNPHQGTMRFGWLDLDLLQRTICRDLDFASHLIDAKPRLALTCLDQIDEKAYFISRGTKCVGTVAQLVDKVASLLPVEAMLTSYGPTRTTMKVVQREPLVCAKAVTLPPIIPITEPLYAPFLRLSAGGT